MRLSGGRVAASVRATLSNVEDPELGVDIGPAIERDIRDALAGVEGSESVGVELVFSPPWSPDRMSDDANFLLGVHGR